MDIEFVGLPTDQVLAAKATGVDAYNHPIEVHTADDGAFPCRHCLGHTPVGEDYLILAWKPFHGTNPYTETGPIFLCSDTCQSATPSPSVPAILQSPQYLVRGYSRDERIVYGTGTVVPTPDIPDYARHLLLNPNIAFVDVRSAANNCFQCRVRRASTAGSKGSS